MHPAFPIPRPTPLSAPFWDALRQGVMQLQCCDACGAWRWTPQLLCRTCHSDRFTWTATSGRGLLYSYTIVHRPPLPAFTAPYVVAVVELDEGPLMLTNLVQIAPEAIAIGMALTLAPIRLDETITLYPFTAA